ncbi:MAG: TMEM14 family protein [bacterium]
MKMASYIILAYGVLVLVGGILGYVKSQSLPSIISGVIFGILIILSAAIMLKGMAVGTYSALIISAFLAVFFTYRFIVSHAFMPAGLMIILSLISLITLIINLRR